MESRHGDNDYLVTLSRLCANKSSKRDSFAHNVDEWLLKA